MFRQSSVPDHVVFLRRAAFLGMCAVSLIVLFPVIQEALCLCMVTLLIRELRHSSPSLRAVLPNVTPHPPCYDIFGRVLMLFAFTHIHRAKNEKTKLGGKVTFWNVRSKKNDISGS